MFLTSLLGVPHWASPLDPVSQRALSWTFLFRPFFPIPPSCVSQRRRFQLPIPQDLAGLESLPRPPSRFSTNANSLQWPNIWSQLISHYSLS